jgi:uroporphyrinogen-III synthase
MYRTLSNDVKELLTREEFDVICLFTPSGVRSLFDNVPKFKQNGTVIGAFGSNTFRAAEDAGLKLEIKAPLPQAPSMVAALDQYLSAYLKKK